MASVEMHDLDGGVVGSVDLPESIFGVEPSQGAIYYAIKAYLTNQRQGNAATKTRSEIDLTKRKLYRQKGTGRARVGAASSPIRIGGGVAHGPRTGNFRDRLPKKVRRLAIRSAFSLKALDGNIRVLQDFALEEPETKRMAGMVRAVNAGDGAALLLTADTEPVVVKSCRNLPGLSVRPVAQVSVYDVVRADTVILTRTALDRAQALWGAA